MDVTCDDEDLDLSEPENQTLTIRQYVIVKYKDNYYLGIILKEPKSELWLMLVLTLGNGHYKRTCFIILKMLLFVLFTKPQPKNNRCHYTVSAMEKYN
ncbi:hypothetical protein ILUMI_05552 [Ignelater luminosus]|uniref:Uncharacterized protein n=1 Tax=Ignelater luminosus TaxID=2038154 RepID=A0A8K0D7H8_IGNLU|nr:hypothetical protein ILUMI_05552 [Ignelater luminosus]